MTLKGANSENIKENLRLEEILSQKVTLETDIMDFLMIAGWRDPFEKSPQYNKIKKILGDDINKYINKRWAKLPTNEKSMETRFYNCCAFEIEYGEKFRTIGELKNIIEQRGVSFRGLHYKTLAHFNKTLKKYGIKTIRKVSAKGTTPDYLARYGLEISNK